LIIACVLTAVAGVSAIPYADNLRHFNVAITGPEESPYAGELKPF
jgi:ubiquitin-protein ligase